MTLSPARQTQVDQWLRLFSGWVEHQPGVLGALLVGSHARGAAEDHSDVDVLMITASRDSFAGDDWLAAFTGYTSAAVEDYGLVTSRRLVYPSGLEVELSVGDSRWVQAVDTDPLTRKVLSRGFVILWDRAGELRTATSRAGFFPGIRPG